MDNEIETILSRIKYEVVQIQNETEAVKTSSSKTIQVNLNNIDICCNNIYIYISNYEHDHQG